MICDEIKKLVLAGCSSEELRNTVIGFSTFEGRTAELYANKDYKGICALYNGLFYSYRAVPNPNKPYIDSKYDYDYRVVVLVMYYDAEKDIIHMYHSYQCDIKKYPEDLDAIIEYLEEAGYKELSPVEFFDLQTFTTTINRISKDNVEAFSKNKFELANVNIIVGIPNKTNNFFPDNSEDITK